MNLRPDLASAIISLRPCIAGFLVRACQNPDILSQLSNSDEQLANILRQLSKQGAWRHGLEQIAPMAYDEKFCFFAKILSILFVGLQVRSLVEIRCAAVVAALAVLVEAAAAAVEDLVEAAAVVEVRRRRNVAGEILNLLAVDEEVEKDEAEEEEVGVEKDEEVGVEVDRPRGLDSMEDIGVEPVLTKALAAVAVDIHSDQPLFVVVAAETWGPRCDRAAPRGNRVATEDSEVAAEAAAIMEMVKAAHTGEMNGDHSRDLVGQAMAGMMGGEWTLAYESSRHGKNTQEEYSEEICGTFGILFFVLLFEIGG